MYSPRIIEYKSLKQQENKLFSKIILKVDDLFEDAMETGETEIGKK